MNAMCPAACDPDYSDEPSDDKTTKPTDETGDTSESDQTATKPEDSEEEVGSEPDFVTPYYDGNCQAWYDPECSDENCAQWAEEGQCDTDSEYMLFMCPIACEQPDDDQNCRAFEDPKCSDEQCDKWAEQGKCEHVDYADYMRSMCPSSCKEFDPEYDPRPTRPTTTDGDDEETTDEESEPTKP
jgi:hypothetical protein